MNPWKVPNNRINPEAVESVYVSEIDTPPYFSVTFTFKPNCTLGREKIYRITMYGDDGITMMQQYNQDRGILSAMSRVRVPAIIMRKLIKSPSVLGLDVKIRNT